MTDFLLMTTPDQPFAANHVPLTTSRARSRAIIWIQGFRIWFPAGPEQVSE
jgi:hypothetical protein